MTTRDEKWLAEIVERLARLRSVPSGVLADVVAWDGACMNVSTDDRPPGWLYEDGTDRELPARLCRGCPVQQECLELELRMFGDQTVGVWGALGEDDRRALVPLWRRAASGATPGRRPQPEPPESNGGDR